MPATRRPLDPLDHPDLPPIERMLEVLSGLDAWSETERRFRTTLPGWPLREAEAHVALAMLETTPAGADVQLGRALDAVRRLPGRTAQAAACRYLRTFLAAELQQRFDSLTQERCSGLSRRSVLVGASVAAGGLFAWLSFSGRAPRPSSAKEPELALLSPRGTTKAVGKTYYADDKLHYRRTVRTGRRFVWLVTADKLQATVRDFVERGDRSSQAVALETTRQLDAQDGHEYFIIVVADELLLPRPAPADRRGVKLAWTDEEVQQLQARGDDDGAAAELVAALLKSRGEAAVEVFVSNIVRKSTVR